MPGEALTFVPLPPDVNEAVDEIVPSADRTAFLVDLTRQEITSQNRSGSRKITPKSMIPAYGYGKCDTSRNCNSS
ncbi:MAG TPA: hypothetical protein VG297_26480, partial [Bryobacteraceae bacterium]|nr:hypothetical protein [Bryobacteraceae bacterium]